MNCKSVANNDSLRAVMIKVKCFTTNQEMFITKHFKNMHKLLEKLNRTYPTPFYTWEFYGNVYKINKNENGI